MNDSVMKEQKTIIVRENNSKSIKINVLHNDSYYDLIEKIEKKRGMQLNNYVFYSYVDDKILELKTDLKEKIFENNISDIFLIDKNINAPLTAMFLGPKAENAFIWKQTINEIFSDYIYWRKNYFPEDSTAINASKKSENDKFFENFSLKLNETLNELKTSFPFHSPRYIGHMLSGQTLPAFMGYFTGMLYNPNNVTDEAAPVTVKKEIEFGKDICKMLGYSNNSWAHICSGGTIANLESMWASRQIQFCPLIIRDICEKNNLNFYIKTPDCNNKKESKPILELDVKTLLSLIPNESMFMPTKFCNYLVTEKNMSIEESQKFIKSEIIKSDYNIRIKGFHTVLNNIRQKFKISLKPVIFVPESAHYSWKKSMNVLGYGEDAIRPIPLNDKFRIDEEKLKSMLVGLAEDEYIVAVVAVVGTTEEGAVDPVHRIKWLRDELSMNYNKSFWLHVDAAWGGYFATLLNSEFTDFIDKKITNGENPKNIFNKKVKEYIQFLDAKENYTIKYDNGKEKKYIANWEDTEVISAIFALKSADSVTIDPHKMGYVPYPAGVIAFKNAIVTHFLEQNASYIATEKSSIGNIEIAPITAVGSYILEGSKPGAAALSCWLSSKVLPLNLHNHGKIVKTTALNARRFANYLQSHQKNSFIEIDNELVNKKVFKSSTDQVAFRFELLYNNIDTNIVCFFVKPMKWKVYDPKTKKYRMEENNDWTLEEINELNEKIYKSFSINPRDNDYMKNNISQKFYISKTKLEEPMYKTSSLNKILDRLGYNKKDYQTNGLVVMRSTIMNPWYYPLLNNDNPTDYFWLMLTELHRVSRIEIENKYKEDNDIEDMRVNAPSKAKEFNSFINKIVENNIEIKNKIIRVIKKHNLLDKLSATKINCLEKKLNISFYN